MNFLKKLFGKSEKPIRTNADFWSWFSENEKQFHRVVKNQDRIDEQFFDPLSEKLSRLPGAYFYVTGMADDETAELVLSAEGTVKNIVFVEELVAAAPELSNWKFTALKPVHKLEDVNIAMAGYDFCSENIWFYSNEREAYPDEIDITIVHEQLNSENEDTIQLGCYIFLDHLLGELNMVTLIDNIQFARKEEAESELVPIGKLNDFVTWREKEFVEKYEGVRRNTENDSYSSYEGRTGEDVVLISIMNSELLEWDGKASHPWMLTVKLNYDETQRNGMPDEVAMDLMDKLEDQLMLELKDEAGYLNVGRQTGDNCRIIYFACKEFRKCSKVVYNVLGDYSDRIESEYEIFKDKYWICLERYRV